MGIDAEFLGELQTDPYAVDRVIKGSHSLVSPENLCYTHMLREMLRNEMYQKNLVAFVVDEAHCIRTWLVLYSIHVCTDSSSACAFTGYCLFSFRTC
jgi:hypothetical protein